MPGQHYANLLNLKWITDFLLHFKQVEISYTTKHSYFLNTVKDIVISNWTKIHLSREMADEHVHSQIVRVCCSYIILRFCSVDFVEEVLFDNSHEWGSNPIQYFFEQTSMT